MEEVANGTKTADGTEQTLTTQTAVGTYVLMVSLENMVNGDVVELRAKAKTLSGGASKQADEGNYADVQISPVVWSIPIPIVNEIVFTLKQTAGTNRNYPWSVMIL